MSDNDLMDRMQTGEPRFESAGTHHSLPYDILYSVMEYANFETLRCVTMVSHEARRAADCFFWRHSRFHLSGTPEPSFNSKVSEIVLRRARTMESLRLIMISSTSHERRECAEDRLRSALAIIGTLQHLPNLRSLTIKAPTIPSKDATLVLMVYKRISAVSCGHSKLKTLQLVLPWRVGPLLHEQFISIVNCHPHLSDLLLDDGVGTPPSGQTIHITLPATSTHQRQFMPCLSRLRKLCCPDWETLYNASISSHLSLLEELHITRANFRASSNQMTPLDVFIPLLKTFSLLSSFSIEMGINTPNSHYRTILTSVIADAVPFFPSLHSLQVNLSRVGGERTVRYFLDGEDVEQLLAALSELSTTCPSSALFYLGLARIAYNGIDTNGLAGRMFSTLKSLQCIHLDDFDRGRWHSEAESTTREYKRRDGGGVIETAERWIGEDE